MRGIITRRIGTILVAATVPLVMMAAGASAATLHPARAAQAATAIRAASAAPNTSLPRVNTAALRASTVTTPVNGKTSKSTPTSPDFFGGFCVTVWSGRFVATNCYGVGAWRQYAYCSASGFVYTSPWLPEPPVESWYGACPGGQYVISAGVQF
ncbi:MAG: hypothetical protein QOJ73_4050 [Streptosporangiaceae bacterium]|jgi:hypothetical protein|nr:hypothetical protein [Streptosporangiaceae bacterium]